MFVKLAGQNRSKIKQKLISVTKIGAQGDQAAPRAPKLKPNDGQSLPKVLQRHPKIPKVSKSDQKWSKSCKNASKNEPNIEQNGVKNVARIWNDFGEDV